MKTNTKTDEVKLTLRGWIKRALAERDEYDATARHLSDQLRDLDRNDPESHDAARVWSAQLSHAIEMSNRKDVVIERYRNELAEVPSSPIAI